MQLSELLNAQRSYVLETTIDSKKRTLETLSQLLASEQAEVETTDLFEELLNRERLGSTAIGQGIAIPHARSELIETPCAALILAPHGIAFDAPDGKPVDIICGLLVPHEATDEHLKILSHLAKIFSVPDVQASLRACTDARSLYQVALKCAKDYG